VRINLAMARSMERESMKNKITLMIMFAGILTVAVSSTPRGLAQTAPRTIDITAKRFSFDPGEITLKKGEPVVLVLKSADVAHGLRIRELNVNMKVGAHGTAEAHFTPDKTGDFLANCSVFCGSGHGSMILKLHVVD
jgi:cytochrome c oxidase subunit 2